MTKPPTERSSRCAIQARPAAASAAAPRDSSYHCPAVRLVHGTRDRIVPVQLSKDYAAGAEAAGDDVRCDLVRGGGHFGVIDPQSRAWPVVLEAFRSAAKGPVTDQV